MTPARLTILHTNDMHNRLTDGQAAALATLKRQHEPAVLLLDAGDAVGAGNLTYRPEGEPILQRMNRAGYDAMTVGNREFHFTSTGFACKVGAARFPVLCANVRPRTPATALPCQPHATFTVDGFGRVAVFGLTVPMITPRMTVRHVSAYVFDDPLETARRLTAELRPNCDLLICLSHLGIAADEKLAISVAGIDVIVGGHSHTPLPDGKHVGETLIAQSAPYAQAVGVISVMRQDSIWCREAALRGLDA